MLPPHELKNKEFSKAMRGYNSAEVDEHIDFLIEKYTELYRENDELDRKLKATVTKLEEYKKDEESIRSALINAQKASSQILNEANERADTIVRSARTNCDTILEDFAKRIKEERDSLYTIRQQVITFKAQLFEIYRVHIEYIEQITPELDDSPEWEVPDSHYSEQIVQQIKKDVADNYEVEPPSNPVPVQPETKPAPPAVVVPTAPPLVEEFSPTAIFEAVKAPIRDKKAVVDDDDDDDTYRSQFKKTPEPAQKPIVVPPEPFVEEPTQSDTREHIKIQRTPVAPPVAEQPQYKVSSVKDTIKELNKRFLSSESAEEKAETSLSEEDADNDTDYLDFVENVTTKEKPHPVSHNHANRDVKELKELPEKGNKKNKPKPLTSTQEFEFVYSNENNSSYKKK